MKDNRRFKNRVIYQIYPMSFCDSNNDGYGDINGIISKLDYLKDLGVGMLWLSPIYLSDFKDNGYDIIDYYKIHPTFGTMEEFENLIKEADKRDIKIVMDLVINHTSTNHVWFKEALRDKNSKYRNYYYFKEGKGKNPPNNWNSSFSGSCWHKVEGEENMYYLHLYTIEQADLNYHSEELIEEVKNILKFYLDKGVYGFRCDVINQIYKTSLEDGKFRFFNRGKEHYESQPMNHVILKRLREEVLDNYDTFLVGETSNITPEIGREFLKNRELDMFFEFDHSMCDMNKLIPIFKKKFKPYNLIKPMFKWQTAVDWIGVYLENHDQRRSVTRYGNESEYHKESSKALGMFLLSLKGTPFVYQGQEIGMTDLKNNTIEDLDDCLSKSAIQSARDILHISEEKAFNLVNKTVNRDHARTPFQWENSLNAGFNNGNKPWLKINDNYQNGITAKDQENDPNSILNFYRQMIKVRNENDTLKFGEFIKVKSNKNVAKFIRQSEEETLLVVVNLSNKTIKDKRDDLEILISTHENPSLNVLRPYEGIVYKLK